MLIIFTFSFSIVVSQLISKQEVRRISSLCLAQILCHLLQKSLGGKKKHKASKYYEKHPQLRRARTDGLFDQDMFSLCLSEDRKPKDFQHSVRLTKSYNIPCSECDEVKPVPAEVRGK